jgi:hypothetical protein
VNRPIHVELEVVSYRPATVRDALVVVRDMLGAGEPTLEVAPDLGGSLVMVLDPVRGRIEL